MRVLLVPGAGVPELYGAGRRDIDQANQQLGQPFKHTAALTEARTRRDDIRHRIAAAAAPATGDTGTPAAAPTASANTEPDPTSTVRTAIPARPSFRDRLGAVAVQARAESHEPPATTRVATRGGADVADPNDRTYGSHSQRGPRL
jgi:hypothetical protein